MISSFLYAELAHFNISINCLFTDTYAILTTHRHWWIHCGCVWSGEEESFSKLQS